MQLIIKTALVISAFLLHHFVMWDITLHNDDFRLFPLLAIAWLAAAFATAWSIALDGQRVRAENIAIVLGGIAAWTGMAFIDGFFVRNVPLALLIVGVTSTITFGFVRMLETEDVESFMISLFPYLTLGGLFAATLTVLPWEPPQNILLLLVIMPVSLFIGVVLPSMTILFPLYIWVFANTKQRFFSLQGIVLVVFPIAAFLASSSGRDVIFSHNDPCYEVVEGKAPSYVIRQDRVCVLDGSSTLKTLEGADAASFEEIGSGYARDKYRTYYNGRPTDRLNGGTLRSLGDGYVADDKYVSYYGNVLEGSDPSTFVNLPGHYYAKDSRRAYYNGREISGADAKTFNVFNESKEYAKDAFRVYNAYKVMEDADPATFRFLDERFSRDSQRMYCNGELLKDIHVETAKRVGTSDYVRDGDIMYYCGTRVSAEVNASAFRVMPAQKESGGALAVWKDDCGTDGKTVVCNGKIQHEEDPKTFFLSK
jgi:hypothetical protein